MKTFALGLCCAAFIAPGSAQIFNEVEPNDSRAGAQAIHLVAGSGSRIRGEVFGSNWDYFRITTASTPFGIYRHQFWDLNIEDEKNYGIEGVGGTWQDGAQIYSLGNPSTFVLYVSSTSQITGRNYDFLHSRFTPTTVDAGIFQPGTLRFRETNSLNSNRWVDLHVFDSSGRALINESSIGVPIGLFDFESSFGPGTYYAAVGRFLASEHGSPFGNTLAPGLVTAYSEMSPLIQASGISISTSSRSFTYSVGQRLDSENTVAFYRFQVVPEPGSLLALAMGTGWIVRRRSKR